jgi:hypothetical protein
VGYRAAGDRDVRVRRGLPALEAVEADCTRVRDGGLGRVVGMTAARDNGDAFVRAAADTDTI